MKLLITGDWHFRANPPKARLDDLLQTILNKIAEVGEIAQDHHTDAVIIPGDLFDSPTPAYSTLTAMEAALKHLRTPIYTVAGNHDELAHSLASLSRTAYGHLQETGQIRDLMSDPLHLYNIALTGTGFSTDTDHSVADYLVPEDTPKAAVHIHVAHGMLLERAPGFELKHTLLEDVAKHPACPDVLVAGHEHLGFGVKRIPRAKGGELIAINPGALVRLSAHPGEIERMPQVCLVEIYPGTAPTCPKCGAVVKYAQAQPIDNSYSVMYCPSCKKQSHVDRLESDYGPPEIWSLGHPVIETTLIPLRSARPGHEVLSRVHIEQAADREAKMGEFLGLLSQEGEAKFLDIQAMVEGIAQSEGLPRPVVDEALTRIAAARESLGGRRGA